MVFSLTDKQQAYLSTNMNKVSRSFALVAPAVEAPLNDYLATAYLICRVVDNIEDCTQQFSWQRDRFAEFAALLELPSDARSILSLWEREAWPGLNSDEQHIMSLEDGLMLWQIYALIPREFRASIARWALIMAKGMEEVSNSIQTGFFVFRDGIQLPAGESGYDKYCYYVAGTVGHMITEMVINHYEVVEEIAERLLENSEASGRALQKTNIVKDFAKDLERGTCYLPDEWMREVNYDPLRLAGAPLLWSEKVLVNVLDEFEDSVNYILDLPKSAAGFRKASLLMLLPGYQTLLQAARDHQRLFTPKHDIKISRMTMAKCMLDARQMVSDNDAILTYSRSIRRELSKALDSAKMRVPAT